MFHDGGRAGPEGIWGFDELSQETQTLCVYSIIIRKLPIYSWTLITCSQPSNFLSLSLQDKLKKKEKIAEKKIIA